MKIENVFFGLLLIVLLILALGVGINKGFIKLPSGRSLDIGGSGTGSESVDWSVLGEEYDYVIQTDGTLFWAEHDGDKFWISNNKTAVFESAANQLTSGGTIYAHEVEFPAALTFADNILIIENYQGRQKIHSNVGNWLLPQLAVDPSTAGWGVTEKGRMWFNTVEGKIKFWDGSLVQTLPSVSGGSTYKLSNSYTVYSASGTFYAMDEDGNVDYSNSNATTLFTSVKTALAAVDKGIWWIMTGEYNFTIQVDLSGLNNVIIEGQGYGTHLYLASGRPTAAGDGDHWRIFWCSNTAWINNVTIRGIRFDGNIAGNPSKGSITGGIALCYFNAPRKCLVEYCWFQDIVMNGMDMMAWGRSMYDNKIQYCQINNCNWNGISVGSGDNVCYDNALQFNTIERCGDFGICAAGQNNYVVNRTVIRGNTIKELHHNPYGSTVNGWRGIGLEGHTYRSQVEDNVIMDCRKGIIESTNTWGNNTYEGNIIYCVDSPNVAADAVEGIQVNKQCQVIKNTIYSPPTNNSMGIAMIIESDYCLFAENVIIDRTSGTFTAIRNGGGDYCTFRDNDLSKVDGTKINFVGTCSDCILEGNLGFVTKNSLSGANTTATTAVISHGLAGTADYVWCSFSTTAITGYTWSSTSSQITVTVTGTLPANWTVYAKVEYYP